jgi:excinuclease UvrABC ATPase subunit
VSGGLLVTNVDDANVLVDASVVNRLDVTAAQREQMRDAVTFESLRNEPAAVNECHAREVTKSPFSFRSKSPFCRKCGPIERA